VSRGGRKLQVAPPAALPTDEQALLVAYRSMDDRARRLTFRLAISSALRHPAPAQRGPCLSAMPAAALPLLKDFCSMDDQGREDVIRFAGFVETQSARRQSSLQPTLRLIVRGLS
jgi:hypothetical protein